MGSFNSLIFPAPKESYNILKFNVPYPMGNDGQHIQNSYNKYYSYDKIITIKSTLYNNINTITSVPCLFLPYMEKDTNKSTKLFMIYFHGNAENIYFAYDFVNCLRNCSKMNVIAMEYPGYGEYKNTSPSSEQISHDAINVHKFVLNLAEKQNNVFIFGRSIGTGAACHVACQNKLGGLILMSPYTSIKQVSRDLVGNVAAFLLIDRFRNIDVIDKIECPIQIIHGGADTLIQKYHSQELEKKVKSIVYSHYPPDMTHNDFNTKTDIIDVVEKFLVNSGINIVYMKKHEINFENFNLFEWTNEHMAPIIKPKLHSLIFKFDKKPEEEQKM